EGGGAPSTLTRVLHPPQPVTGGFQASAALATPGRPCTAARARSKIGLRSIGPKRDRGALMLTRRTPSGRSPRGRVVSDVKVRTNRPATTTRINESDTCATTTLIRTRVEVQGEWS